MQESYRDQYSELWHTHWWWRSRQQIVNRVLCDLVSRGVCASVPYILDIGCAGGFAFDELSKFGEIFGIEPDSEFLRNKSRWSSRIENTPFDGNYESPRSYDIILMLDVLEHIEDDSGALVNLARMLKPGGHAIVTVPALPSLWSVHDVVNFHFRRYTRQTFRSLVATTDLRIDRSFYFFSWSVALVYMRKLLSRMKTDSYRVSIPPRPVNSFFRNLTVVEDALRANLRLCLPWGSSLLAVLSRPLEDDTGHGKPCLKSQVACQSPVHRREAEGAELKR